MTNNKNYSIERQREVVARAQEALAIKPRDERERWAQDDAIKTYLEQYKNFAGYYSRKFAIGKLKYKASGLFEYFNDAIFDFLPEIELAKYNSPLSYISMALRKARNSALEQIGGQITISHHTYNKSIKLNMFKERFFCEHGTFPSYVELRDYEIAVLSRKKTISRNSAAKKNYCYFYGKRRAVENAREYNPDLDENIFASMRDNPLKIAEEKEDSALAKTAFEAILSEREKAVVAFRIGEYEWLPEKYRHKIGKKKFLRLIGENRVKNGNVTMNKIGNILCLTKERVRQIKDETIKKIKAYILEKNGEENG